MAKPGPQKINRYGLEFKLRAVLMSEQPGVQVKDVAQSLCIHPIMLSKWRKQVRDGVLRGEVPAIEPAPLAQRTREGWQPGPHELADDLQIVLADPSPLTKGRDIGVLSLRTWRLHSQTVKHALIAAGVGWGRLPAWQVEADIQVGRLVRIPVQAFGPDGRAKLQAFLAHRVDQGLGVGWADVASVTHRCRRLHGR